MNLHEYQTKFRFADFGIPIMKGKTATTPQEAYDIARELNGPVVVKAQVLAGGRGKAGGVKLAQTPEQAEQVASNIIGMTIKGLIVRRVLVDPAVNIGTEIRQVYEVSLRATGSVDSAQAAVFERTTWLIRDFFGLSGIARKLG